MSDVSSGTAQNSRAMSHGGDIFTLDRINILVVLIVCVFSFEYAVTCAETILPWVGVSNYGLFHFFLFTSLATLGVYFYLLCVLVDPGVVPRDYAHDPEDVTARYIQVKKTDGAARHCNKCDRPKPPRAHHCRVCRRCVLRMDHHCPWVNNCIGHGNYKAFLLFLIYTELALVYAFWLHFAQGWYVVQSKEAAKTLSWLVMNSKHASASFIMWATLIETSAAVMTVPLAVGVGGLLCWHLYITSKNLTTIEYHEGVTAHQYYSDAGKHFKHPYDLGCKRNWDQAVGFHSMFWFVQGLAAAGDGTAYPTTLQPETIMRLRDEFLRQQRAPLGGVALLGGGR